MTEPSQLWPAVDRLLARAERWSDLEAHGVALLARPGAARDEARATAARALAAPVLLERVREICTGPIVLLKGPHTAAHYPQPACRAFTDLDLLVPDALRAHSALLAAGFVAVDDAELYKGIHHLRPLHLRGFPLTVEVHSRPKWPEHMISPPVEEIINASEEGAIVDGILTLPPPQHAVLLAAHAWAHEPFGRLRHLVDVAAVASFADANEIEGVAMRWQIERIWRATAKAIDALFYGASKPWSLRVWARSLAEARERTVLEQHLEGLLAPFCAYPASTAVRVATRQAGRAFARTQNERWPTKLSRTRTALKNATRPRSQHHAELATLEEARR